MSGERLQDHWSSGLFLCIKKKTGYLSAKSAVDGKLVGRIMGENNNE